MLSISRTSRLPFLAVASLAAAGLVGISPPAHAIGETCLGVPATIVGDTSITGTAGDDVIVGSPGDDYIDAGSGDDLVCAGDGGDAVVDGAGKDHVLLGAGDDADYAHNVKDAHDVIEGGDGTDGVNYRYRTANLKLRLDTTTADDGETGEYDKLLSIEDAFGGDGNDLIVGTDGDNALGGGDGNDTFNDLAGADRVYGGPGNDRVTQGAEVDNGDILDGGAGTDLISYAKRPEMFTTLVVDLNSTYGDSGFSGNGGEHDQLFDFDNAVGGVASEAFYGTDGPNVIKAGGGYNGVFGLGGDDTITTGGKADLVDGGSGFNTISMGGGCDWNLQSELGRDTVNGGTGACDKVDYQPRSENLLIDLASASAISGADGEFDLFNNIENAYGGAGDDVIWGTGGANLLAGGDGAYYPQHSDGSDTLHGAGGADSLSTFDGVGGNDVADGGPGSDQGQLDSGDPYTSVESFY